MRPGAPVGFGLLGEVPWIGLPGNPVSTMVTFELFVRPAIRKLAGRRLPFRRAVRVRLAEPIKVSPTLQHFLRAVVTPALPLPEARLTGPQGSGILTSMVKANALLVIPEGQTELLRRRRTRRHPPRRSRAPGGARLLTRRATAGRNFGPEGA